MFGLFEKLPTEITARTFHRSCPGDNLADLRSGFPGRGVQLLQAGMISEVIAATRLFRGDGG